MLLRNERGKYLSDEIGQIAPRDKLEESKSRFRMSRTREDQEEPHGEENKEHEEYGY